MRSRAISFAVLGLLLATASARGADAPAPALTLEQLLVTPAAPTATTLCHLEVELKNTGTQPAASLRFDVTVGGKALPVYANQVFMQALPPGATTKVKLYNFWVSETGRPAPADGKLAVEVALVEAKWMKIGPDAQGVETWEPTGAVPGLPQKKSVTLTLAKKP